MERLVISNFELRNLDTFLFGLKFHGMGGCFLLFNIAVQDAQRLCQKPQ